MLLPGTSLQRCTPYSLVRTRKKSSTGRYADSVAGLLAAGKTTSISRFYRVGTLSCSLSSLSLCWIPFSIIHAPSCTLPLVPITPYSLFARPVAATATIRWLRRSIDNHPSFPSHDRTDRSRGFPRSPLLKAPRPRGERERHDLHRLVALAGTT